MRLIQLRPEHGQEQVPPMEAPGQRDREVREKGEPLGLGEDAVGGWTALQIHAAQQLEDGWAPAGARR
jgi:hypothetical protein